MDQDFHYTGTYYAARIGGDFGREDATLIAKAANFIDFMSNESYAGYWCLVSDSEKRENGNYDVVGKLDAPRYSFQGKYSTGLSGSSGLWASYHFPPGNYDDPPDSLSHVDVHGEVVAGMLPGHGKREVDPEPDLTQITEETAELLNRPQSALSRAMIQDTIRCLNDSNRLEEILGRAAGGERLLESPNRESIIERFGLLLLGARAHVIADTWAHQDFAPVNNVINTYWDIDNSWAKNKVAQRIEYQDVGSDWKKVQLMAAAHENLQAVPFGATYLGHGWIGRLPDFAFLKYRYRPSWQRKEAQPLERDNPSVYKDAFLELCSLFSQANGDEFDPNSKEGELAAAAKAISKGVELADKNQCPRVHSSHSWIEEMGSVGITPPAKLIDCRIEPDDCAKMGGQLDYKPYLSGPLSGTSRYGTFYINVESDLYLFQIAADYHFHFVKHWMQKHQIGPTDLFEDGWSIQLGPLSDQIAEIMV